ncbi:MAG: putative transposase [Actinomycetota bacterium]|jgi:transposase InsO family protein|nr:putative transposase [Actinomycetota bacterium]
MVERAAARITHTIAMNTRRAGCGGSRTSGSEGGPGKPTSRKADRAPWSDPYTYLHTQQGWLYLAVVRDACSRRVLGWAIEDHLRADLIEAALQMALDQRGGRLPHQVVFHADRGTQYTSTQISDFATANNLACSVGRAGVCWDNAMAESFFATLKVEFYYRHTWTTRTQAKQAVNTWIAHVYNRRRRHSALGMTSPIQFEITNHQHPTAIKAA